MLTPAAKIDNTLSMKGSIRTKEVCPRCRGKFSGSPLSCPVCLTHPERFFIDLYHKGYGRIKVYSDKQGHPLDSHLRASRILETIRYEMDSHTFDPLKYVAADLKKFWATTLLDKFLSKKLPMIAPSYQKNYETMNGIAKSFFGIKDVREIRKVDIYDFHEYLQKRKKENGDPLSSKSVKNFLDVFKTFLRWCLDLELIDKVPAFPQIEVQGKKVAWITQDDQIRILESIPEEHRPLIIFLMLHGCRPGEARALRCKDVSARDKSITITSTFSNGVYREKRKGRRSSSVTIPIHPEIYEFLRERVQNNLPEAYVFSNPKTGRYYSETYLKEIWQDARSKAGFSDELKLYGASRHSFGSILANSGVSIYKVSKLMGHSSVKVTEKYYLHSGVEDLRQDISQLSLNKATVTEINKCVPRLSPEEKRHGKVS